MRVTVSGMSESMKYPVVLADPPWHFHNYDDEPGELVKGKLHSRKAQSFYPTMSIDDICSMVIPAEKNSALFLWACWPLLPEAMRVITSWGFEYKTIAWVWTKFNESSMGTHVGMGYYTRANTEPCLLAVRGSMPVKAHDVQALIMTPVQEHSRKPIDQYRKIERLYDGPYLELFARQTRPGWTSVGNEIDGQEISTALAKLATDEDISHCYMPDRSCS